MKNDSQLTTSMLQYRQLSTSRAVFDISFCWAQIFFLLALSLWFSNWWIFPFIFVLVGARQYGLLVLLHDAQHALLSPNHKTNNRIATWFLAAPCGVIFSKSRLTHITHHQHLGAGTADPDFPLYCTGEPEPKSTRYQFLLHFLRQIAFEKFARAFLMKPHHTITNENLGAKSGSPIELLAIFICQLIIFCGFSLVGFWQGYFLLWILPLMIIATFFNDLRIFCEHSNPLDKESQNKGLLISYLSTPWERFFLGPYQMNYHAEHHFFPFIPHHYLPKVRKILQTLPDYQKQIQWRQSYWSHLKAYLKSSKINTAQASPNEQSNIA